MSVKWEDIKVGDKLKIEVDGLVSKDWHDVTYKSDLRLVLTGGWTLYKGNEDIAKITAHQPAPRKVEVTLGTPLPMNTTRDYTGYGDQGYRYSLRLCRNAVNTLDVRQSPPGSPALFACLGFDVARRLALDILATTGIED